MALKNIADQTNGFYIPCVSLLAQAVPKKLEPKHKI